MTPGKQPANTPPRELEIRRYQPSDRDGVLALHDEALRETGTNVAGDYFADLSDIDAAYLQAGGEFLVGTLDGALVAMGAFVPLDRNTVEILRMRVHPGQQRRGFGKQVLEALEQHARRRGFASVRLETTLLQSAARALYERRGYHELSRGVKLGFEIIRYEKSLGKPSR